LVRLARISSNAAIWREANSAYRESLAVFTRQSAEVEWATAQIGIAKCMMGLAAEAAAAPRFADAIASFRQALEVLKPDRSPVQWLEARTGLGMALLAFSEHTGHQQAAGEAMSILDEVDGKLDRASQPEMWAAVRGGLGRLKLSQARKSPSPELLDAAIAALESALHVSTKSRDPMSFRRLQRDIGSAYELLAAHSPAGAVHHLEAAVASYRAALETVDRSRADADWARLELDLGRSLFQLGSLTRSERNIAEALVCDQAALEKFQELGLSDSANSARDGLDEKNRAAEKLRGSTKAGSNPSSHESNRSAGSRFRPADLGE
jgi:tetratricopeptide (TPR) repeat protein